MASDEKDTGGARDNGAVRGIGHHRGGAFSDGDSHDVAKCAGDNGAHDVAVYKCVGAAINIENEFFPLV